MCGRGVATLSADALASAFRIDIVDESLPTPSFNIAPTQNVPVVVGSPPERRLTTGHWSLVPAWSDQLKLKFPTFNARIETAAEKPTFKSSVTSKRCLIPFDGYYEWVSRDGAKVPHYIHRRDEQPLALAGLYSWWRPKTAAEHWVLTVTILTQESAGALRDIHDRMPVTVQAALIDRWLDPELHGDVALLREVAEAQLTEPDELEIYAVAPLRGDAPDLIAPVN